MANRRSGGMGGGPRGRSFSHQPFQGSGLNPWQGSNNSMNQGLLSNPQQLAMALTSLLQPQQQPPSLLSLNASPAFSHGRDFGRFGNRGRDMRRLEPYNKGRHSGGFKRHNQGRKSPARDNRNRDDKKDRDNKIKKEVENLDVTEENIQTEDGEKKGPYSGIPIRFLNCFVCSKEMWNAESMSKHINGKAHKQMLDSLEESMHLIVNILREHMRLTEEKKIIEWNRQERLNRRPSKFNEQESHCNMCDLKFLGKIIAHRKTEGHQRLKRYLHPNCRACDKEFPSRMDWVEHRLTPEHLRRIATILKDRTGGIDGDKIVLEEELDVDAKDNIKTEDPEDPIFELMDDLTDLENRIPCYNSSRGVAIECLKPFEGLKCDLCDRSFETEELANSHLKSKRHYYSFVNAAKTKYQEELDKKNQEKKKLEENGDETKDKEEKDESAMEVGEEGQPGDTSVSQEEDEEMEEEEEEEEEKPKVEEKKPVPAVKAKPVSTPGPKSKKLAVAAKVAEQQKSAPANYRIPKVTGKK